MQPMFPWLKVYSVSELLLPSLPGFWPIAPNLFDTRGYAVLRARVFHWLLSTHAALKIFHLLVS
jgi:hypothetical protein